MNKLLLLLAVMCCRAAFAQTDSAGRKPDVYNLGFEKVTDAKKLPDQWHIMSPNARPYVVRVDSVEKHSGRYAMYIASADTATDLKFAGVGYGIPAKYQGKQITVRAWMKSQDQDKPLALMMGLYDADGNSLAFDNMFSRKIRGTSNWKQYSVTLPLPPDAQFIHIGPILIGKGKLWVDDVEVLVDGKPITDAPLKPDFNPNPPHSPRYGSIASAGHTVKLKDATLYYETYGTGEPLLLLHGNSQSIYAFLKQIPELSKKYKVIAVDTRGQGKSTDESTAPLSYDQFADDMKQLLDSLHITKTNILGWSDGGNTALIMAIKYPSYVNKVAETGANLFPTTDAVGADVLKNIEHAREQITGTDAKANEQRRLMTLLLTEPHISVTSLHTISAPVLVMAGEKDMIKEKHTRLIAASIPHSELMIFKDATHYVPVEKVQEFNRVVVEFFDK